MRPEYTLAHPSVPPHGVKGGYEAGWEGGMVNGHGYKNKIGGRWHAVGGYINC